MNKTQQDVLLTDVEQENIVLFGATTENPSFEINRALLSRAQVIVFHALKGSIICILLENAIQNDKILSSIPVHADHDCLMHIANVFGGDVRNALNCLDSLVHFYQDTGRPINITSDGIKVLLKQNALIYDKKARNLYRHYINLYETAILTQQYTGLQGCWKPVKIRCLLLGD